MACTLEELQAVEYEILCKFADFCEKYDIKYTLAYGTLLGAIRHDGFIPWDDDIDVYMGIKDFNKLRKLIKKHPIDGFDFSWIDNKHECHPFYFAKIRKRGTYMPEPALRNVEIGTGVWIDIFIYLNRPTNNLFSGIQDKLLGIIQMSGHKYINRVKRDNGNDVISASPIYRFVEKCPNSILRLIKKALFFCASILGKKDSQKVRIFDFDDTHDYCVPREWLEPITEHVFTDREFSIPVNYAASLIYCYGEDYMIPKRGHIHAHLDEIEL